MAILKDLFDELVELSPAHRAMRLAALAPAVARELDALLDADGRALPLLEVPAADAVELLRDEDEQLLRSLVGTRIGPFRVLELLGQGGSAAVFRAERPAGLGSQQVALKLLRTGLHSREAQRRFLREQAILAQLSHPDIARLVEGGVSESGIPYIAMELVAGTPLTRAADARALPLVARLQLFVRLCRAVQAAHAALVVHCDLKPSNILVDTGGGLKVLDFGIAKLLDAEPAGERTAGLALTPEYAAPEQFLAGAPSVGVDVYALGVILGELLTGQRLRGGAEHTVSAAVRADALAELPPGLPARRALVRRLRGDVDAIVDTALASDPALRYRSAEALARDVERHLAGLPVHARPATRGIRAAKFVRRHWTAVALAGFVAAAMIASVAVAVVRSIDATREAAAARLATMRADSLRDFMFDAFAEAGPSAPRNGPATIVDAVERALANVRTQRDGDPRVMLELKARLAEVLSKQGAHDRAADVFEDARVQARQLFPADDALVLELDYHAAKNLAERGDWLEARAALDALLARMPAHADWVHTAALTTSAWLASRMHERARAFADSRDALERARAGGDARRIEQALRARGSVLIAFGDGEGAVRVYADLLARQRAQYGEVHARVAAEEAAIARAYRLVGDYAEAERHARAALAIGEQVYTGDHWHKALHLNALAMIQIQRRDFERALESTLEQVRIQAATLKDDHPDMFGVYQSVGVLHGHLGDLVEAERWTRRAADGYARLGSERQWAGLRAHGSHAHALAMLGRRAEAEAVLTRALSIAPADAEPSVLADLHERAMRIALDADDLAAAARARAALDALAARATLDRPWPLRIALIGAELDLRAGAIDDARAAAMRAARDIEDAKPRDPLLAAHAALIAALAAGDDDVASRTRSKQAADALAALPHPPRWIRRLAELLAAR